MPRSDLPDNEPKNRRTSVRYYNLIIIGLCLLMQPNISLAKEEITTNRVMCRSEAPPLQTNKMLCYVGEQQKALKKFIWEYYKAGFYVTAAYYDPTLELHFVFLKQDQ